MQPEGQAGQEPVQRHRAVSSADVLGDPRHPLRSLPCSLPGDLWLLHSSFAIRLGLRVGKVNLGGAWGCFEVPSQIWAVHGCAVGTSCLLLWDQHCNVPSMWIFCSRTFGYRLWTGTGDQPAGSAWNCSRGMLGVLQEMEGMGWDRELELPGQLRVGAAEVSSPW